MTAAGTDLGAGTGLDPRLDAGRDSGLDADGAWQHAVRGRLTVAVGEVELVLADPDAAADVRAASAARVLAALAAVEDLLARRPGAGS